MGLVPSSSSRRSSRPRVIPWSRLRAAIRRKRWHPWLRWGGEYGWPLLLGVGILVLIGWALWVAGHEGFRHTLSQVVLVGPDRARP
ncbi:hypothetical protein [Sulfobacillus thermosulfidooxidans]|uniref:hypothetical protein n=1 Tax=Sulfobacillus thermosulfidooxidans TaxID=28034 RepID=UPI0006B62ED3|nr:hypothetical protein [Sulfobacillus thermosulfidooxidans]